MRHIAAFATIFIFAFAFVRIAGADPNAIKRRAEDAYNAGVDALNQRDYEAAVLKFEEAYRLRDVPEVAFNIARVRFERLDQPYAARTWLRMFLRVMHYRPQSMPPEVSDLARAIVSRMDDELDLVYGPGTREALGLVKAAVSVRRIRGGHGGQK